MTLLQAIRAEISGQPAGQRRSIGLQDDGEIKELLADPETTKCPHCGKPVPPPKLRTRRRRIYALRAANGAILHYEIEP